MASAADIAKALDSLIGGNDEESTVRQFLSTGYAPLDHALSAKFHDGGFPVGRIIEVAGPASAGKTALSSCAIAAAQRMGGIGGFSDHERSFSMILAPKLGMDVSPGRFVFKKPRTFEESITLCVRVAEHLRTKKLIPAEAPIAWIFDSLASMVPQSALVDAKTGKDKSAEDRNMNDNTALARATSAHMPAFAQYCDELGICAIFLNQIRMKMGVMYGDPRTTPGGEAPKFYASQRIMLGSSQIKKGTEIIGAEVTAAIIKNKIAAPFKKASYRFMFQADGTGRFDVERSTVEFLDGIGALESAGPGFVKWNGVRIGKEALARKIQAENGMDELRALLPANYEPPAVEADELPEAA
jgi:protein RecA